jgi:hypothetical protein
MMTGGMGQTMYYTCGAKLIFGLRPPKGELDAKDRNTTTGETVELDNKYGNVWAGSNGQYILSDQAGFDPNTLNIGSWTRMQQGRR